MERKLFYQIISSLVMALFVSLGTLTTIYAQGRSGELPGAKPTPTPPPRGGTTTRPVSRATTSPPAPAAPVITTLAFNQEVKGKLDTQSSDKSQTGNYFDEFTLTAKIDDLITFQLQSANPGLAIQVLDKDKAEITIAKDATTGDFKINTPSGGLPSDGEYRVRVTGIVSGKNSIPYTIKVNRLGLVHNVYYSRLDKIYLNYRETDPASVDETIVKLVELAKDDANKPAAYELLGLIFLNNRRDMVKAEWAMEQSIKNSGAAVIKITFDSQWRKMAKVKSGRFDWEEPRSGYLKIYTGRMILTDPGNKPLATLNGAQIKNLAKIVTNNKSLVTLTTENARRPFLFVPGNGEQGDADLVIRSIQTYVIGKGN